MVLFIQSWLSFTFCAGENCTFAGGGGVGEKEVFWEGIAKLFTTLPFFP